jgi:hypothetical protein
MTTPVDRVLAALRDHGHEPKRSGKGWSCRCPAHEDRSPSLSVNAGDDGRALVRCHAGCTVEAVCAAIGLQPSDLFDREQRPGIGASADRWRRGDGDETPEVTAARRRNPTETRGIRGSVAVATPSESRDAQRTYPTAREAVAALVRRHGARSNLWTYRDANGDPVGVVLRWDTTDGKDFRPVSRTPDGAAWFVGGMPTPRPLYALPELLSSESQRVYVTEGEKAADATRSLGVTATTSPHGCKSARGADWSPLRGHEVVVIPDNDANGEGYAQDVAELAAAAGAASVRIVRLSELWPEIPKGGDMAELLAHRGGDADAVRRELEALTERTAPERPDDADAVAGWCPFPIDDLPEPIRSFVRASAAAMVCDPAYVALPMLSACAVAIGNTHRLSIKNTWTEPAILWTAIVGESGTAKSPAIEAALSAVRQRQRDALKRHAEEAREHAEAMAVHARDMARWSKANCEESPPERPEAPIAERCWTDDATTEALVALLQQNPRGLLMVRDELAGWLLSFDRYTGGKGGDAAKWLEMFGGRPLVVDRKSAATISVPCAWVAITGGIQPETLRRALGKEHRDSGLAARLLLAWPPRKAKRWTEADVPAAITEAIAALFDRLFVLKPDADEEGDARPWRVTLDDAARSAFVRFFTEHNEAQVELHGDDAAAWSKLEGYAPRLALVFHLIRHAADDPSAVDPRRVDLQSMEAAIRVTRWFAREALRVNAMLSESDTERTTRQLAEWIERKGGAVTVRDLTRGPREYRNDPTRAEAALQALVAAGVGCWDTTTGGAKGGRPADRFRLTPRGKAREC